MLISLNGLYTFVVLHDQLVSTIIQSAKSNSLDSILIIAEDEFKINST
jgi:hypothetical protein